MSNLAFPPEWLPNYNVQDYQRWEGDWELIRGFPFAMSPAPKRRHQYVGGQFVTTFNNELRSKGNNCNCEVLYETDWIINDNTVVRPDVMIVCDAPPSDFITTPPVLVLEIFSAHTRLKDRNIKFRIYEENGVRYYLMADSERNQLEVFQLQNNSFVEVHTTNFVLTDRCSIQIDLTSIW